MKDEVEQGPEDSEVRSLGETADELQTEEMAGNTDCNGCVQIIAANWCAGEEAVAAAGASDNLIAGTVDKLVEEGMMVMLKEEPTAPPLSLV